MSMVQKDYILRMIEQMTQVIGVVLGLSRSGDHEEAVQVADNAFQGLVGFSLADIEVLRTEDLIALLRSGSADDPLSDAEARQLQVIATLLHEVSGVYDGQGDPVRRDACRLKALELNLTVFHDSETTPDSHRVAASIDTLTGELADHDLPPETVGQLWQYHAGAGQYAEAEDRLFALLEAEPDRHGLIARGIAFYSWLAEQPDTDLERGGLPRDEVFAGLSELRSIQAEHISPGGDTP